MTEKAHLGTRKGARGRIGMSDRIRKFDLSSDQIVCVEFWTRGPDFLLDDQAKDVCRKKIHTINRCGGIELLSYVILDSHCFLIARIPQQEKWLRRARKHDPLTIAKRLYSAEFFTVLQKKFAQLSPKARKAEEEKLRGKYCDLSYIIRLLKETVSREIQARHNTSGAFWAERFGSLVLVDQRTKLSHALRIDLWPVTQGLLDLKQLGSYRWSSYTEACEGSKAFRRGLCRLLEIPLDSWEQKRDLPTARGLREQVPARWYQKQLIFQAKNGS